MMEYDDNNVTMMDGTATIKVIGVGGAGNNAVNRIRRLEKKEQIIAAKKAKEEDMANARMNNVVRGVTKDLTIQDTQPETVNQDIDIHEIQPVANDDDVYMDDIYDPLIIPEKHNNINRTSDIWEVHSDRQDNDNTALDHGMSYDETISTREDDYEEHDTEYWVLWLLRLLWQVHILTNLLMAQVRLRHRKWKKQRN